MSVEEREVGRNGWGVRNQCSRGRQDLERLLEVMSDFVEESCARCIPYVAYI